MMGRMEAGEGRGGLSEESSPFLPKLPARFVSLPPRSLSAAGEATRQKFRWMGMGQGAADFLR